MANATKRVGKAVVRDFDQFEHSVETLSAETNFYVHAMIGIDATGYYCKGDDTQSWLFAGVSIDNSGGGAKTLPAGTAGDGTLELMVERPDCIELAIASVAVTDLFKPVYAIDDQTGTLDPSTRTYANFVGHVIRVVSSGVALVQCNYDGIAGHAAYGATKFLAATGTQTLSKLDLGKNIVLINTATHTVNLPAVASCPAGSFYRFIKKSADAAAVTIDADASEEIDSSTTYAAIDAEHDCATLVSDGTQWHIVSRDIA